MYVVHIHSYLELPSSLIDAYLYQLIMTVVPNMFYHILNQCKNRNRNKYKDQQKFNLLSWQYDWHFTTASSLQGPA